MRITPDTYAEHIVDTVGPLSVPDTLTINTPDGSVTIPLRHVLAMAVADGILPSHTAAQDMASLLGALTTVRLVNGAAD